IKTDPYVSSLELREDLEKLVKTEIRRYHGIFILVNVRANTKIDRLNDQGNKEKIIEIIKKGSIDFLNVIYEGSERPKIYKVGIDNENLITMTQVA
ncbi:MAG: hypothetical protein ACPGLV_16010, partial [Bacteroidia bacterium]